jgi:hypothetical protein
MKRVLIMMIVAAIALSMNALGANLIVNGDFEAGNDGSFTSEYIYEPIALATGPEAGSSLWDEGEYAVGYDPGEYHVSWTHYYDHTTGLGLMLIVNGADDVVAGSEPTVWEQSSIPVVAGVTYRFTYYIRSCYPAAPGELRCTINGTVVGSATAPALPSDGWLEVSYIWNSGLATTADIHLVDLTYIHTGNDFTIDDISLEPVATDSATGCNNAQDGTGDRIKSKGTWFMYNKYPELGGDNCYPIQAGNPLDGVRIIGEYCIADNGDDTYTATYAINPTIEIGGVTYDIVVTGEHLGISDAANFKAKPGQDDNADFGVDFGDGDGVFYIFAHFEVEYW